MDELFYREQCAILEQIARGTPLAKVLDAIVRQIERHSHMVCSILLLEGDRVIHGAAPNLPPEYATLIDGQPIGPDAGSCGAAAFHGRRVVVEDIATDPRWAAYRQLALPHGLRACWSEPIVGPESEVLGTFAIEDGASLAGHLGGRHSRRRGAVTSRRAAASTPSRVPRGRGRPSRPVAVAHSRRWPSPTRKPPSSRSSPRARRCVS